MTWATCTILHNRVVGKLKTVSIDVVKKTSMVVRWRLDCTDRVGIVSGYKVTYCPIDSFEDTADCSSQILVQETTEEKVEITNLEPYTIYKVRFKKQIWFAIRNNIFLPLEGGCISDYQSW